MTWMNTNESITVYIPALCRSAIEAIVTTYGATLHIIDNVTHDNFICNRFIGTIKITSRHHIARIYCATSCAKCLKIQANYFFSFTSNDAIFQTWNMLALQSMRMQYYEASPQWHHIRKSSFPKLWRRGRLCGILTTNLWKFSHQVNIWFYIVMMVVICKQMAFLSG